MGLAEKIKVGMVLTLLGGLMFGVLSLARTFGTRKTEDIYSFQYHGRPAVIKHEDIRWGPDRYYFLINGKEKLVGTLVSDEGKEITVKSMKKYSHQKFGDFQYSIRDAKQ